MMLKILAQALYKLSGTGLPSPTLPSPGVPGPHGGGGWASPPNNHAVWASEELGAHSYLDQVLTSARGWGAEAWEPRCVLEPSGCA